MNKQMINCWFPSHAPGAVVLDRKSNSNQTRSSSGIGVVSSDLSRFHFSTVSRKMCRRVFIAAFGAGTPCLNHRPSWQRERWYDNEKTNDPSL